MSESTGHHEIPKEELTESNFSPVRTCTGTYGVAELVEFKGTGGQDLDCVRVKVGELSGPLDLDPLHALADHLDKGEAVIIMHPTYKTADGVYATLSAPRGTFSQL